MSDSPSAGELLAGFGGDVDQLTDYYCGQIDSDGEPTEYYDGGNSDGPVSDAGDSDDNAEDGAEEAGSDYGDNG
jgi:hypothetical protein